MLYLLIVSLLWAPSFGLVPKFLGGIDSNFVAAARIALSLLVFAPFVRPANMPRGAILKLMLLGAIQFGFMYVLYIHSFAWGLKGREVALFTIFTPLLVTLFDDLLERRMSWLFLITASIAVAGTAVIQWTDLNRNGLLAGFLLMQLSNACFALGQVLYRRVASGINLPDRQVMGVMYAGALVVSGAAALLTLKPAQIASLTPVQWLVLAYLGAIASGIGFFLFNAGARKVNVGALAIFNNVKIPLAILTSVLIFGDKTSWPRLAIGGAIIALALALNQWFATRRQLSAKS